MAESYTNQNRRPKTLYMHLQIKNSSRIVINFLLCWKNGDRNTQFFVTSIFRKWQWQITSKHSAGNQRLLDGSPLVEIILGKDSNFSLSLKPSLHFLGHHRLGRIHRKEDIQPLRDTYGVECRVCVQEGAEGLGDQPRVRHWGQGLCGAGTVLCFLPVFLGCKGQVKNEQKLPYIQVRSPFVGVRWE